MELIELSLIALALAVDCFTVSIATGIVQRRFVKTRMTLMALSFGLFQGGMFLIGYLSTSVFSVYFQTFDHWIAFGLLSYLGGRMIYADFRGEDDGAPTTSLTPVAILTMSIATSIDALAVGVSMACMENGWGVPLTTSTAIIAFCSTALSVVGIAMGISLGKRINWHIEAVGGLVLITIGIKILCEHLTT